MISSVNANRLNLQGIWPGRMDLAGPRDLLIKAYHRSAWGLFVLLGLLQVCPFMAGAHHVPFVSSGPLYISIGKITGQKQRLRPHFTLIHHSGV